MVPQVETPRVILWDLFNVKYKYTKILKLFSGYTYMIFMRNKQMLCFNLGPAPTIPETESVSDKGSSPCWSDYLQEEASEGGSGQC